MEVLYFIGAIAFAALAIGLWHLTKNWEPAGWYAGPRIDGRSKSKSTVRKISYGEFAVSFDQVHYVTKKAPEEGLRGKIVAEFQYDGVCYPVERPMDTPSMSLYFQREGDDWSAAGKYSGYRWYSAQQYPITAMNGPTFTVEIDLDDISQWISVTGEGYSEEAFEAAKADPRRVGVVFGHAGGRGHGVWGVGTFACTRFDIIPG